MQSNNGVALIIEGPDRKLLILEEFVDKPRLKNRAGDNSTPMEEVVGAETDYQALLRLWREELPGMPPLPLPGKFIGQYQIVPSEWANLYAVTTAWRELPVEASDKPEVGNYRWLSLDQVLKLQLRPGAREMFEDHAVG